MQLIESIKSLIIKSILEIGQNRISPKFQNNKNGGNDQEPKGPFTVPAQNAEQPKGSCNLFWKSGKCSQTWCHFRLCV